jgi:hypothetical protein
MIRALVIKELRECLPLAALAAAIAAWVLHLYTGGRPWPFGLTTVFDPQPFLTGDPWAFVPVVAGSLAVVLGLKQTWWDDYRGNYYFLLHRPVARSRVFLTKIAVGIAIAQAIGAAMILIFGAWAATPGTHASPFFWAMTLPAWQMWLGLPVAYLGGALTGLRPARWYGSKLAPLAACIGLAALVVAMPKMWMTVLGLAIVLAILLPIVLYVAATRDY